MRVILGIDAAWTDRQPSGVALVKGEGRRWSCLAVAASYQAFIERASGPTVDCMTRQPGVCPEPKTLLDAAKRIADAAVDIVTIDMPVSNRRIAGRREADNAISRSYGARWCSAHSPSVERPGNLGSRLTNEFEALGYPVATTDDNSGTVARLVEVYPHVGLLALLQRDMRVPYKVSKSSKYWPNTTPETRIGRLLDEFAKIRRALGESFSCVSLSLPARGAVATLNDLKRYEDALDALVCCWIGTRYVSGDVMALGDTHAAIWCPRALA